MEAKKLKVLLIVEQCNPDWASVPLEGYRYFHEISKLADVTLVTHERNQPALEKYQEFAEIVYINESSTTKAYYQIINRLSTYRGRVIWPLYHALRYPVHIEFDHSVYKKFQAKVLQNEYDIVHVLTPMEPRYPFSIVKACKHVPFILGPVNGGVPFPPGFQERAKKEFSDLNFIRAIGRLVLPGYAATYKKATRVLAGSTYTLNLVKEMFQLADNKISLFYENGVMDSFLSETSEPEVESAKDIVHLLFVGRLVPYKCADVVIEAIARLDPKIRERLKLTIVGDGSERSLLENKVQEHQLNELVQFTGWINQQETLSYYKQADIFCFPSIREYGGAVVLEAMACGTPCIVANNGGIGEYVTEETGFRIEPLSREYLTQELADKIRLLVEDETLRAKMSAKSIERVREFTWQNKATKIIEIYSELV